ncbi:MAG: hypothetical protein HYR85_21875 [Planctomycetes bacterium]|nr:hypothetical protein [Planctomycetota bacterium]MBI3843860.1 hypothetical protein [Planctomycetota bacterium]
MRTRHLPESYGVRRGAVAAVVVALLVSGCAIEEVRANHPIIVDPTPVPVIDPCPPPAEVVYQPAPPPVCEPVPVCATPVAFETQTRVSISLFEQSLSPFGDWVVAADYGRVWRPTCVPVGFQPYTVGHWVYTDCGWSFVSDAPWGAVVYHYGRWTLDPCFGWVWVPDTVWAPAWVSWRACDDYIGWAPLPPGPFVSVSVGFSSFRERIHPRCWSFVRSRDFLAPCAASVVVDSRRNTTFIHETTNITNITIVNQVARNVGPDAGSIERSTREHVQPRAAVEVRHDAEMRFLGRGAADARTEKAPSGFSAPRSQSFRNNSQATKASPAPFVDAPEKTRSAETSAGFAGLRGRVIGNSNSGRAEASKPAAKAVPFASAQRPASATHQNPSFATTAPKQQAPTGDRTGFVRAFRNTGQVVAPAPQVEGKRFGSGSAATPRPTTPAVPGVVNRPNRTGTVVVPFRQPPQPAVPSDSKKADAVTSRRAAQLNSPVVPTNLKKSTKEDKNKKS